MDDIVLCNKRNEVPRCFKHNTGWQARVQELLNKMRDKHIKPIYMQRFNKLLCTCENLEYANLWEDISDEELKRSVHFLQNYIDNNTSGELVELCSSIMSRLRRDGELYNIVDNVTAPTNYKRSSAAKLCYLLQKIVEKDFSMMEPKKPSGVPAVRQKEEKSLVVELDEITPGFVKHLIGDRGKNILNFMRQERCKVEIKSDEGTGKVQAVVTKSVYPQDMAKLEAIGKKLQKFAIDTKEEHESYENTFGKPNSPTESYPASALGIDPSSSTGAYGDQEADRTSTIVKTEHSVTSSTPSTRISSNTSTSTTVGSTQTAGQSVSPSQASTRTMPETNTYNHIIDSTKTDSNADPCPTSCIVHDRRWLSTYQYTLNQCYNHFGLSRNYGSKFSRNVCTCRSDRPEARHYFITEDDMVKEFENCRKILQNWPKECQLIIQPLINQLIKYDKSDIWHSLFKFVYYIHGISGGASDCLRADHKLPGLRQANLVPRPEKPYLYQVNFAPQDSKASSSSGASVTMATGTNSIGPSLGFASLLSTAGSSVTNSTRDHGSQACCSMHAKMNELKEIPVATPKKKLKRVHKEDWSDDCYFHAKKKRSAFQCVVNTLLDNSRLPTYLSKPFCFNVCICNETVDMKDFYKTKTELQDDCRAMLTKLKMKRGPSQSTIKPFINDLEKYLNEDTMTDGLMKFVFYYMKASYGNWTPFEETYESMKGGN